MIKKLFSLSSDSGCDSGSSIKDDSPPLDIPGVDMDVIYEELRQDWCLDRLLVCPQLQLFLLLFHLLLKR